MIQNNYKVTADEGKFLKTKYGILSSVELGQHTDVINGQIKNYTLNIEDIKEVTPVTIDNKTYYLESTDYKGLVSELIRIKYTLDDELALYANSRIGEKSNEEIEFQKYRVYCKQLAKSILNE